MRLLPVLLVIALFSVVAGGCGGVGKGTESADTSHQSSPRRGESPSSSTRLKVAPARPVSTLTNGGRHRDFNDGDRDPESNDDDTVLKYGHAADTADKRAVTAVVMSYYAAAADGNGSEGCRLIYPAVVELILENSNAPSARASQLSAGCPPILSKMFDQHRQSFVAQLATLQVTGVRVEEEKALALLRFASTLEPRKLELHREGKMWKIWSLFDTGLP